MAEAGLRAALVLPIILLAAWLPGRLALRFFDAAALRLLESQFAALSLGLAFLGWSAFLLAELGLFSPPLLALLWLALTLALAVAGRAARPAPPPQRAPMPLHAILEPLLILLWLPAALWLFLRPHEAILGGADAGVYVSTAAHIAQQGGILVHDTTLAQMAPELQAAVLRPIPDAAVTPAYLFPSFNVASAAGGLIIPDFFHYHPTWQAVAYALGDLLAGTPAAVHAALLMPGLWALLGALAVYLTVYRLVAPPPSGPPAARRRPLIELTFAALALAALTLNAIQVWFARYPVAETLSQYLLWSGLWATGAWLAQDRSQRLWALLAGLSFGLLLITRIDMIFILAIPALIAAWRLARRDLQRAGLWFFLPLALLALHAALHGAFISRPYFYRILGYVQQMLARFWPILALVALLAVGALLWLLLRRRSGRPLPALWSGKSPRRREAMAALRPLLAFLALALLALAAYAWFLRPVYGPLPSYNEWYDGNTIVLSDRENLIRLGWYLSPLGVWLAVAGAMLMIWRANRSNLPLLFVGLFFSLLYLWRIQANPHQIYVMRRYVPAVMPFFITAAAFLLHAIAVRMPPAQSNPLQKARLGALSGAVRATPLLPIALLVGLAWVAAIAFSARGFISQIDNQGLTAQLAALDQQLAPHSVILFNQQAVITTGDSLGMPLHTIFGHDVYSLRDTQALDDAILVKSIEDWHNSGRAVYWAGATEWLDRQAWNYRPLEVNIMTHALEGSYDHKPFRIVPFTWAFTLNRIEPRQ